MFLDYLSIIFLIIGSFFMISAMVGLMRYKDFYIKLHTLSMFNIYGASPIIFAMGVMSYNPVIFFEVLFVMVTNIIATVAVINVLFRNAVLSGLAYKAKTRDDITQEEMLEAQNKVSFVINKDSVREARKELRNRLTDKDKIKLEKIKKKEEKKNLKKKEKEEKKREKEKEKKLKAENKKKEKEIKAEIKKPPVKKETNIVVANKQVQNTPIKQIIQEDKVVKKEEAKPKEEMTDIEKENEELKKKIREQKKILRKKIETVRKNAFITRKPEEIQKAEDLIKGILDKYHLTEEMLQDDYED